MNHLASILYFIAASVLLGLALGFQHGGADARVALLALAGGACVAAALWWRGGKYAQRARCPRGWEWVPVVLFTLFVGRAFLWLVFRAGDALCVLSPNNIGDMSLHLTFINYFVNGAPIWPDSPIFAGGKTAYAVGMDFFNSLLVLVGMDVLPGLILTGVVCSTLAGFALWRWGGAFGLMAFLANGTLAGFAAFFATEDGSFFRDYAGNLEFDMAWKSLPLALLVTQRGFLFALPAGLLLLVSWRTRYLRNGAGWRMPFAGELLLYAAMPVFHVHTFIALSFMLACLFVVRAAARRGLLALVGAAFVPASVLLWLTVGMFQSNALPMWENMDSIEEPPPRPAAEVLGWQPGWEVNDEPTQRAWLALADGVPAAEPFESHGRFMIFWLGNFGLWPFLAGAALLAVLRGIFQRAIPGWWAWSAGALVVVITPLLGWSRRYQNGSFSQFAAASFDPGTGAQILAGCIAVFALIAAFWLHRARVRDYGVRWLLAGFGALYVADSVLCGLQIAGVSAPSLRANATPLLAAGAVFVWLLARMSRAWSAALMPAAFVLPGVFLFFVCCNVKFAPWAWDNTKVMLWAYLLAVPYVWDLVLVRWRTWARGAAVFVLFFPGTVMLLGGIGPQFRGYEIAHFSEVDAVAEAVREIPITEAFAAEPTYNHPLLLAGRKLTLGYTAHLDSHGIRFSEQLAQLDVLMNGDDDWRIAAAKLGARYLFFGPRERALWPESRESWRESATQVAAGAWGELYDLETPPIPFALEE